MRQSTLMFALRWQPARLVLGAFMLAVAGWSLTTQPREPLGLVALACGLLVLADAWRSAARLRNGR